MSDSINQKIMQTKDRNFDGPIDLLLSLIEKKRMQINTLSLAKITNDYLEELKKQAVFPSLQVACFVHTASILLFIKSKSLLPMLSYLEEEQVDANILEKRLFLYELLKNASMFLAENCSKKTYCCPSPIKQKIHVMFRPDRKMNLDMISLIAEDIVFLLPKKEELKEKVIDIVITLDEMMNTLDKKIQNLKTNSFFNQLADNRTKKTYAISFLALLELMKQDKINVSQNKIYGDIEIKI